MAAPATATRSSGFDLLSAGLLILRLGFGGYLASHGWGKVQMVLSGQFDKFADPIGLGTSASLILAAGAEFVCSILVILGLFTRLAAIPPIITMAVAAFVAHAADPWTSSAAAQAFFSGASKSWASREPALLFLFAFLAIALAGPGRYSIDAALARRKANRYLA